MISAIVGILASRNRLQLFSLYGNGTGLLTNYPIPAPFQFNLGNSVGLLTNSPISQAFTFSLSEGNSLGLLTNSTSPAAFTFSLSN